MAYCFMNSGVSKSGSPTVRSITSKPLSRYSLAVCAAFNVDDGWIAATLSETGNGFITDNETGQWTMPWRHPLSLTLHLLALEILHDCQRGHEIRSVNNRGWESLQLSQYFVHVILHATHQCHLQDRQRALRTF